MQNQTPAPAAPTLPAPTIAQQTSTTGQVTARRTLPSLQDFNGMLDNLLQHRNWLSSTFDGIMAERLDKAKTVASTQSPPANIGPNGQSLDPFEAIQSHLDRQKMEMLDISNKAYDQYEMMHYTFLRNYVLMNGLSWKRLFEVTGQQPPVPSNRTAGSTNASPHANVNWIVDDASSITSNGNSNATAATPSSFTERSTLPNRRHNGASPITAHTPTPPAQSPPTQIACPVKNSSSGQPSVTKRKRTRFDDHPPTPQSDNATSRAPESTEQTPPNVNSCKARLILLSKNYLLLFYFLKRLASYDLFRLTLFE